MGCKNKKKLRATLANSATGNQKENKPPRQGIGNRDFFKHFSGVEGKQERPGWL